MGWMRQVQIWLDIIGGNSLHLLAMLIDIEIWVGAKIIVLRSFVSHILPY